MVELWLGWGFDNTKTNFRRSRIDEDQDAISVFVFLAQGKYEMRMGYYETAIVSFTKVIEEDHNVENAYILRSHCLRQ